MNFLQKLYGLNRSFFLIKNPLPMVLDYFGMKKKEFICFLYGGLKLFVRPNTSDCFVFNEIFSFGIYTKYFDVEEGDVVIDIGGNVGYFSMYASTKTNNNIYCFEPQKHHFKQINRNISLNNLENVYPVNAAVLTNPGKLNLSIDKPCSGASFQYNYGKTEEVDVISFSEFVKEKGIERIDFMKIDCEGSEYDILFNCPKEILNKIRKISIEVHNLSENLNDKTLKKFLEENGFKVIIKNEVDENIDEAKPTSDLYAWREKNG